MVWCSITPTIGVVAAEQYFGRLRTIIYSSTIYICGLATLFLSSLPVAQDQGVSLSGLLLSLFLIGIGTGGIKMNVSLLIAEQYTGPGRTICVLKSEGIVAIVRDLTL
jgi:POT family proton-dependent oligopeptide transporter